MGGEWLRGLRRLGLPAGPLVASIPALAHATSLEMAQVSEIVVLEQLEAVLGWAVQVASLRRLQLYSLEEPELEGEMHFEDDEEFGAGAWVDSDAMWRAQAQRPDTSISFAAAEWLFDSDPLPTDDED